MKRFLTLTAAALIAATTAQAIDTTPGPDSDKQFFPIASFRVGPYAASGASIWAGRIDYYRYINEVEGASTVSLLSGRSARRNGPPKRASNAMSASSTG